MRSFPNPNSDRFSRLDTNHWTPTSHDHRYDHKHRFRNAFTHSPIARYCKCNAPTLSTRQFLCLIWFRWIIPSGNQALCMCMCMYHRTYMNHMHDWSWWCLHQDTCFHTILGPTVSMSVFWGALAALTLIGLTLVTMMIVIAMVKYKQQLKSSQ